MVQDPTTIRFIASFEFLKKEGHVRSARQFALSIDTYPQSFNDILKGRRSATLNMIQNLVALYPISAEYLLIGKGEMMREDVNGLITSPSKTIAFLQAHQFLAYASAVSHGNMSDFEWPQWELPAEMIGQQVEMAFQCNTDAVASCLSKGDVLFSRKIPKIAWKSNLSSKRVYLIVLDTDVHLVRIRSNDAHGVFLQQDHWDLPDFLTYEDIHEIWCPLSKWSHHVLKKEPEYQEGFTFDMLTDTIMEQNERLNQIKESLDHLSHIKDPSLSEDL